MTQKLLSSRRGTCPNLASLQGMCWSPRESHDQWLSFLNFFFFFKLHFTMIFTFSSYIIYEERKCTENLLVYINDLNLSHKLYLGFSFLQFTEIYYLEMVIMCINIFLNSRFWNNTHTQLSMINAILQYLHLHVLIVLHVTLRSRCYTNLSTSTMSSWIKLHEINLLVTLLAEKPLGFTSPSLLIPLYLPMLELEEVIKPTVWTTWHMHC